MKRGYWLAGAALVISSSVVVAQRSPESILPGAANTPAPAPTPAPATPAPAESPSTSGEVVQSLPSAPAPVDTSGVNLSDIPSVEELEAMSAAELDEALGLRPRYDIPPAARRATSEIGIIAPAEGGLPTGSLARQPASIVRAALGGVQGPMVSRWGHILMRRALASRLDAPQGMGPVEFATLRARALNSMGEYAVARALVQDIDTANYSPALTRAAIDAYIGTSDIVGACPAIRLGKVSDETPHREMLEGICAAFAGETQRAQNDLRRLLSRTEEDARLDVLLAQRFAGAAGEGRRAVTIEWEGSGDLTPWRFAMANALGEPVPENLTDDLDNSMLISSALTPALSPGQRIRGADVAAASGVLSARAIVDLYSLLYAEREQAGEDPALPVASRLRSAYVDPSPAERIAAIRDVWGGADNQYGRYVLTAYAAARVTPSADFADDSGDLVASMLTAGLDRDAMRWASAVEEGSLGWALLALANPQGGTVTDGQLDSFFDDDESARSRKSRMLLAGLAGLGRVGQDEITEYSDRLEMNFTAPTRWTRMIEKAAEVNNGALVAYLAGLGMQGTSWDQMTARHLYHIVSALNAVGMEAEARMIAAEAVARA